MVIAMLVVHAVNPRTSIISGERIEMMILVDSFKYQFTLIDITKTIMLHKGGARKPYLIIRTIILTHKHFDLIGVFYL